MIFAAGGEMTTEQVWRIDFERTSWASRLRILVAVLRGRKVDLRGKATLFAALRGKWL